MNSNHFEGRWGHLYRLWSKVVSQESLPQIDRWLAQEFAKNTKYGSRDRRWYSEAMFAGIRYGYFALFCEEYYKTSLKNLTLNLSEFINEFSNSYFDEKSILNGLAQIETERLYIWIRLRYLLAKEFPESSNFKLNDDNYANEKIFFNNFTEQLKLQSFLTANLIFLSIPLWYHSFFNERFLVSNWYEEQQLKFFNALESRPPMWIRLNDIAKSLEVLTDLVKEGYNASEYSPGIIKLTEVKGGIFALKSFRNGLFEIQDLASQQIGQQVQVKAGQFVWDSCAGGGGKTQQIASLLNNKGVIYASDIREYKLEELKKRAKKSGYYNIRCIKWEGKSLPSFSKEVENKNGFDWVLVDAPCSSSGTWRRNPDSKYRISHKNLKDLVDLQFNILQNASLAVRDNGYLVYSTCSWICDENEKIIEKFLKRNEQFVLKEQKMLGSPFENADSMFVGIMQRLK